jgi:hypothetical protein
VPALVTEISAEVILVSRCASDFERKLFALSRLAAEEGNLLIKNSPHWNTCGKAFEVRILKAFTGPLFVPSCLQ